MSVDIKPYGWLRTEPELPDPPPSTDVSVTDDADRLPASGQQGSGAPRPWFIEPGTMQAFMWDHVEQLAALLRTWRQEEGAVAHDGLLAGMSPRHAAAALMRGLGHVAHRVIDSMRDGEVEWVARAVDDEPPVTKRVVEAVLELARRRIDNGDYIEDGGPDLAVRLLNSAVGPARAHQTLRPDEASNIDFLNEASSTVIAPMVSHEHPQTIALLLSQIDRRKAAGILAQLPERLQADVAYRLATLQNVPPDTLWNLGKAMAASLNFVMSQDVENGGPAVLAQILNYSGSSVEKNVLDQIDAQDPEISERTRLQMFTFEDIGKMGDRDLRIFLDTVDIKDQATALKAATERTKDRWLAQMSEEERVTLTETMEELGPMRLSDVQDVQKRCIAQVRQLEEQGKVVIIRGDAGPYGTFV